MTDGSYTSPEGKRTGNGWVAFGLATGILLIAAVAWEPALAYFKVITEKEPVPWPSNVIVDPDTFRWENLPEIVGGRFEIAADGELTKEPDGLPDGEILVEDDVMSSLGIGTAWDKKRVADRKSNWYITRIYRDNTKEIGDPLRYWRIDVYYYTGGLDTVPHVPERCLQAGGATFLGSQNVEIHVPAARGVWGQPLAFTRARFEAKSNDGLSAYQLSEYYIFGLNGKPEASWKKVRAGLADLRIKHCYFSKIQFGPYRADVRDVAKYDAAAQEFIRYFLPSIALAIPTAEEVKLAGAASQDGQ